MLCHKLFLNNDINGKHAATLIDKSVTSWASCAIALLASACATVFQNFLCVKSPDPEVDPSE
jgi:hypothetical protein